MTTDYDSDSEDLGPSKTQRKRQMHALQELGGRLAQLNTNQLAKLPLTPKLIEALSQMRRIGQREARRRQLQYIGKLMRDIDQEALERALNALSQQSHASLRADQLAGDWRERLLAHPKSLQDFIDAYPTTEIQPLRQLLRQSLKEAEAIAQAQDQGAPTPKAKTHQKLLQWLRETIVQSQ